MASATTAQLTAEKNARIAADTAEASARIAADSALGARITALEADVATLIAGRTTYTAQPYPPEVIPPTVISNITETGVTSTTASITWGVTPASTGQIEYGLTSSYGSTSALESSPLASHSRPLTGLTTGTTYHYRVKVTNAAGTFYSVNRTFATAGFAITSGPFFSSITPTGATVTWYLSEVGQGWIEYGLTASYGSETAHETSFDYNYHVQTLPGLPASTLVYVRVRSVSQGAVQVTATGTFTTAAAAGDPVPPDTGGYPVIQTALSYTAVPSRARPAYLVPFIEPMFPGIKVTRVTSAALVAHKSNSVQPWNLDGSRILTIGDPSAGVAGHRLLNGVSYADLGQLTMNGIATGGGPAGDWAAWSNLSADVIYRIHNAVSIMHRFSVASNSWTVLRDFRNTAADQTYAYDLMSWAGNNGQVSATDWTALSGRRTGTSTWDLMVFDLAQNRIEAIQYNTDVHQSGVESADGSLGYSNTYLILQTDGVAEPNQNRFYTLTARVGTTPGSLVYVRNLSGYTYHTVNARTPAGGDALVIGGLSDWYNMATGSFAGAPWPTNLGWGTPNFAQNNLNWHQIGGWYDDGGFTGQPGYGQLISMEQAAPFRIRSWGFHHNIHPSAQGLLTDAAWSRDGRKVAFKSNWDDAGDTYMYVAQVV